MRFNIYRTLMLTCVPLLFFSGSAHSGLNGIDVRITNDGTDDIVVTVYDLSTEPRRVVLSHERIHGFTTIPISLALDATGRANLSWVAVSADTSVRKCGHESKSGLTDSTSVNVHADSECDNA
jgi:hypothetical protein